LFVPCLDVALGAGLTVGRGVDDWLIPGPMSEDGTSSGSGTPVWEMSFWDTEDTGMNRCKKPDTGDSTVATPW